MKFGRILLIVLSFFILILWIVMFIMTAGSAALSSSCGFIVEINRDNREALNLFSFSDNVYEAIN